MGTFAQTEAEYSWMYPIVSNSNVTSTVDNIRVSKSPNYPAMCRNSSSHINFYYISM